ncbi:MAG: hypothetical protein U1F16_02140 [Turneriella sp.]
MLSKTFWRTLRAATLPLFAAAVLLKTSIIPLVFTNEEIRIDFGGQFQPREQPGATQYPATCYNRCVQSTLCAWQPQPPEVQQVMRPERGFLCELHIMPLISEKQVESAVTAAQKQQKGLIHDIRAAHVMDPHPVLRWRFQAGKTRLDHFLLNGKKFSYLFVSSPYGSNGSIEEIIARSTWLESKR